MKIPSKLFVNVYQPLIGQVGTAYSTRKLADQMAGRFRLACIEIELSQPEIGGLVSGKVHDGVRPEAERLP